MSENLVFVIMQVGEKGSPDRRRADEVYNYVVAPIVQKAGLQLYRSDLDATPGQVNQQMLRKLLEARVVIADLTGRNPNVFYELGIVHSFARPVIALVDTAKSLPFDAHDERVIELGEHGSSLSVAQAEGAKIALAQALDVVLAADYVPASPLAEVAAGRSLDQLAPGDPVAAELAAIRESMIGLRTFIIEHLQSVPQSIHNTTIDVGDALDAAVDRLATSLLLRGSSRGQADVTHGSASPSEAQVREARRVLQSLEEGKLLDAEGDRSDSEDSR
jgi:hypothetical protein